MIRVKYSKKIYILLLAGSITIAFLALWIKLRPPLWYFTQTYTPRELPKRLIDPAFKRITKHSLPLPLRTEELRAIHHGGRDPAIFVSFVTDSNGMSYIKEIFTEIGGEGFEPIPSYILRGVTVLDLFPIIKQYEEHLGINIVDKESIKSALKYERRSSSNLCHYRIIIDIERNKVYIKAWFT
jgi:hypothetical protein